MDRVWFCNNSIKTSIHFTYFSCLILQLLEDDGGKKKFRPKASGNLQSSSLVSAFVKFLHLSISIMCGSRKFCQKGSNSDQVFSDKLMLFLVDEGREELNTTLSGPSLACQQKAI